MNIKIKNWDIRIINDTDEKTEDIIHIRTTLNSVSMRQERVQK